MICLTFDTDYMLESDMEKFLRRFIVTLPRSCDDISSGIT